MLNKIIPYIDARLTEFSVKNGLAELITNTAEPALTYPAVYIGSNNYTPVNIEQFGCYHRIASQISTESIDEALFGCTKGVQQVYPMVLIGFLKREGSCDQFSTDNQVNAIAAKLRQTVFTKQIRTELQVFTVEIATTGINTDREQVWRQEYNNIPMKADFNVSYFAIYYNLTIKADSSCMNLLDCGPVVVNPVPATCSQIAAISEEDLSCLTQSQLEYISDSFLGALPSISVFPTISAANYNVGTVLTGTNGTWLNSPVSYAYQWQRDGVDIDGATSANYTLTTADTSANLILRIVEASNNNGPSKAASNSIIPTLDPTAAAAFIIAGLTDVTQQVLVNTAIVSAKQAGLFGATCLAWYPFVGGTLNRHKINYKNPLDTDAAFRLAFIGGVTHNANGITGNAISGYGNTFMIPNTALTNNNCTVMVYTRTNTDATTWEINARNNDNSNSLGIISSGASANTFHQANDGSLTAFINTIKTGLWAVVRTGGLKILYQSGIQRLVTTLAATGRSTNPIYILRASGGSASYSSKNIAFAAIYNEDLNATQMAALYTIVQTLQTGLGRQV